MYFQDVRSYSSSDVVDLKLVCSFLHHMEVPCMPAFASYNTVMLHANKVDTSNSKIVVVHILIIQYIQCIMVQVIPGHNYAHSSSPNDATYVAHNLCSYVVFNYHYDTARYLTCTVQSLNDMHNALSLVKKLRCSVTVSRSNNTLCCGQMPRFSRILSMFPRMS